MIYNYKCNKCDCRYERVNTIEERHNSGRCPECTSSDTVKVMSTPSFKTCGGGHGKGWDGKGQFKL